MITEIKNPKKVKELIFCGNKLHITIALSNNHTLEFTKTSDCITSSCKLFITVN